MGCTLREVNAEFHSIEVLDTSAISVHGIMTHTQAKFPPQLGTVTAGAATWWTCLWLGQPAGIVLRICHATPLVGPVLGVAAVANASVVAGGVTRAVAAAHWGRPRFGKHGLRPQNGILLVVHDCVCGIFFFHAFKC